MPNCVDDPAAFARLSPAQQACLLAWIAHALRPARRASPWSSYGLKHRYQAGTGIYHTNGEFKGALLAAGYPPINPHAQNWRFRATLTATAARERTMA
jgi:hypothetical protein